MAESGSGRSSKPLTPPGAGAPTPRKQAAKAAATKPAKKAPAKASTTTATRPERRPTAPPMFAPKLRWADDTPIDDEGAKGRILNAAVDCVLRFGVDKTGMDDVARAANITRQTVYKHFSSRNELITSVFLRVLDDRLQRGLETFFDNPSSADDLRDGIADAAAHVLEILRTDETIQAILFGSRIAPEVLLSETATILVGVLGVSLTRSMGAVVTGDLLRYLRPTPLEDVSGWIIRMLYGFLAWPGESLAAERAMFRQYLSPIFLLDEG
jgi:AcrR family transcriptional regulator